MFTYFRELVQTDRQCPMCKICSRPDKGLGPSTRRTCGNSTDTASSAVSNTIRASAFPCFVKKCQTINVTCNSLKKLLEHLSIGTLFMACNSFICLLTFRKRTRILFRPNLHSIYLEHNSIIQVHTAFDQCEIWRNFLRFGFVLFLDIGPLYSFNIFFQRNFQKDDRYGHWHNFRWLLIKKMKNDVGFFYSFKFEYFTYFGRYLINLSRRPPTTTSQR